MRAKSEEVQQHEGQKRHLQERLVSDEEILSSFDPVVEGASFQIIEEGLDPIELGRIAHDELLPEVPEVLKSFDLAAAIAQIPNKLFFRIGEVAELLELKTYVLRFWETEFKGVSPAKSRSGQRVYRKKDVEMLLLIKHLLYVERFSIEGARKRIREIKGKVAQPKSSAGAVQATSSEFKSTLGGIKQLANADLSKFFRF